MREDAPVTVHAGYNDTRPRGNTSRTVCTITSLTLLECYRTFISDILTHLVGPNLETFRVSQVGSRPVLPEVIISFLERSASTLKYLCLDFIMSEEDWKRILESPHIRNLVHLEMPRSVVCEGCAGPRGDIFSGPPHTYSPRR